MEKSLLSQSGEIKGKLREGYFTFTFQHIPVEEELKGLRGSLFILIEIKGAEKQK